MEVIRMERQRRDGNMWLELQVGPAASLPQSAVAVYQNRLTEERLGSTGQLNYINLLGSAKFTSF